MNLAIWWRSRVEKPFMQKFKEQPQNNVSSRVTEQYNKIIRSILYLNKRRKKGNMLKTESNRGDKVVNILFPMRITEAWNSFPDNTVCAQKKKKVI